jgi:hypothetical protein
MTPARIEESYGNLPLSFEANVGQADARVQFLSRGAGSTVLLTATEADVVKGNPAARADAGVVTIDSRGAVARMQVAGGNPAARAVGLEQLPGKVNYFLGNDPARWHTNVPAYARVEYQGVYPGVDLVYYGSRRQLEYDFVVAPGADPRGIRLGFAGAQSVRVDAGGDWSTPPTWGAARPTRAWPSAWTPRGTLT